MPRQFGFDDQGHFRGDCRTLCVSCCSSRGSIVMARMPPFSFWNGLVNLRAQCPAGMFGKFVGIFGEGRVIAHFFQNAGEVADGNPLGQEVLQNPLHLADAQMAPESIR